MCSDISPTDKIDVSNESLGFRSSPGGITTLLHTFQHVSIERRMFEYYPFTTSLYYPIPAFIVVSSTIDSIGRNPVTLRVLNVLYGAHLTKSKYNMTFPIFLLLLKTTGLKH